jgi:release factor glutamine methyltransferase
MIDTDTSAPLTEHRTTRAGLLRAGRELLHLAGVTHAEQEAAWLLEAALGISHLMMRIDPNRVVEAEPRRRAQDSFRRRASREPLQYILGTQEFCGLELVVTPDVLIPRPETELLVEEVLRRRPSGRALRIADIGTGSGCLAVTVARFLPEATIFASDRSTAALAVARSNARRNGVEGRIQWLEGDLFRPFEAAGLQGSLNVILANLPYVPEPEWDRLQPEVRLFEPRLALVGGPDGLDLVRRLIAEAWAHLACRGLLILELGQGQAAEVRRLIVEELRYGEIWTRRDHAGIERVVVCERD